MILFIVLVHYSCKVLQGLLTGLSCSFVLILFLSGEKSVVDPQVCFVCRQRRSNRDQFVVISVVTLLLNVVFNDSTIYGQKNELECVIVLAVALEAGGHSVT